jgi:hypothetical protein
VESKHRNMLDMLERAQGKCNKGGTNNQSRLRKDMQVHHIGQRNNKAFDGLSMRTFTRSTSTWTFCCCTSRDSTVTMSATPFSLGTWIKKFAGRPWASIFFSKVALLGSAAELTHKTFKSITSSNTTDRTCLECNNRFCISTAPKSSRELQQMSEQDFRYLLMAS